MPCNPSVRELFPKNLTVRFGAHSSSFYGSNSASKTAPLTTAAKDQVSESHVRDLIARHVRPMIMNEEFPDYQKLLDVDEVDTPPLTLSRLPDRNPAFPTGNPPPGRFPPPARSEEATGSG
jgi:hypothetical protein